MVNNNAMAAYRGPVEDNQTFYYPAKQEVYEAAELAAFSDILCAGYTGQAIRNAGVLAGMAVEAANRYPEYSNEFRRLVDEYVDYAAWKINGR